MILVIFDVVADKQTIGSFSFYYSIILECSHVGKVFFAIINFSFL